MSHNKYALITGATSGIGFELAKLFARDKFNLIIVARNQQELDEKSRIFESMGVKVKSYAKDLFKREDAFSLCTDVERSGIQVDVLVNDAGQGLFGEFKNTDIQRELDIIDLNISAVVILTKHFLKDMISRKKGKILNLASVASTMPGPWQSVYHGTKAFVLSFSEAIREEVKDTGITITALMPGVTDTDFFNKADMQSSKVVQDKSKMADPADVAKDGYEALMSGEDKIVSGMKNKIMVAMNNIKPDKNVAHSMNEQQKPVDDDTE